MGVADALPHVQAFMAVLAGLPEGCAAYLGGAPADAVVDDEHSYVVAYPDPGAPEQTSLELDEGFLTYFSLHGTGIGPEQALWALDQARKLLVGATPTVNGRDTYRIWQEQNARPLGRDTDVTPPLYVAYAEFGMRSDPA